MKKIALLLALLTSSAFGLSAQVVIRGNISNVPSSAIPVAFLEYWAVDHWQQVAILQLENGGDFSTDKLPPAQAQCQVRMTNQPGVRNDFLLPGPGEPCDSVLRINLDMRFMDGRPVLVAGYPENDLYFTLMSANHTLIKLRDSSSTADMAQQLDAVRKFNRLCTEMSQQHRGTFTGDIVANLVYLPQPEEYPKDPKVAGMSANAFVIAHDLDTIPFRYDRILNHNAFERSLNRYYNYFDHTSADGSKNYVENIMSHRNGSDAVDLFLFKYMLDKMMASKNEAGLEHLLTWYLPDCSDESPLTNYTKTLIQALQNCAPGKVLPDMEWPDANGKNVSLSEVCAKNKMTLLFFWKSNCSHCREFKPVLAAYYEKFHPQGLEVLALSLDRSDANWKQTLQTEPTNWVNVYVPNEQREAMNKQFPVPATPTLISLDSNRKVLNRLILRDQLEAYLKNMLAKLNGG